MFTIYLHIRHFLYRFMRYSFLKEGDNMYLASECTKQILSGRSVQEEPVENMMSLTASFSGELYGIQLQAAKEDKKEQNQRKKMML